MAQAYASGIVPCFVAMSSSGPAQPVFLGTGETGPDISEDPRFTPVQNDIGGDQLPFDRIWSGSELVMSLTLTYWNEAVLERMYAWPYRAGSLPRVNAVKGAPGGYGDVGSLMVTEGLSFGFWAYFSFSKKPAYATMNKGIHAYYCVMAGQPVRRTGTRANKVSITIQAMRGLVGNDMKLADKNMSEVENLAWV